MKIEKEVKTLASDILDQAAELEQLERDHAIQNHLNKREVALQPRGRCYNCDEPIDGVFCDVDCRDDYDHRVRRLAANRF
jgi:hypothetical protein